ncbi:MAG: carbonic anhydrase, partial [Candidatus Eremiobacteraeota bacterium]|nr:carbonic anhydrase [Candidatus Eremiobacteraeota bacterium]
SDHVVGSIEYAVQTFGSSLIMVLGHSHCGAVTAAVEAVTQHTAAGSRIASIVESIRPAVESVRNAPDLLEASIDAHVRAVTSELARDTAFDELIASGSLAVVGAEYHLETGLVEILTQAAPTPAQRSSVPVSE